MKNRSFWNIRAGVWFVLVTVCVSSACSRNNPPQTSQTQPQATPSSPVMPSAMPSHGAPSSDLKYQAPDGWIAEKPTSSMRVAQYKLPRAEGDAEDALLAVFYFGQGQGGTVEANLARWTSQMEQPGGSQSNQKPATKKMTVNGMNVTLLDVSGSYRADSMMMGQGAVAAKANHRLRAAVVETPSGPYFFKLVGPEKTVKRWDDSFMKFVESARYE
jgi:hypothetical protein